MATETGMLHPLEKENPGKTFIAANRAAVCRYMKMITLPKLRDALRDLRPEVSVDPAIAERARVPIERMVAISPVSATRPRAHPCPGVPAEHGGGRRLRRDPVDHTKAAAPDGTPICAAWVHDRYAVRRGGRSWATWHPPIDPRHHCAFGHEHGSNPHAFRMFRRTGMPAFGPIGRSRTATSRMPGSRSSWSTTTARACPGWWSCIRARALRGAGPSASTRSRPGSSAAAGCSLTRG